MEATPARERLAERLLQSTAARSYDPQVDVDWSAPLVPGLGFMPEHRVSLYGTELWERLTPEQRLELGKHEAASVAGFGLWLEFVLMRLLAGEVYRGDPTSRHVQYALAEIAEECRHSTMFARLIERLDTPAYGPRGIVRRLGSLMPLISYGPAMWGAVLLGEEIPDRFQRELVDDESIQPLMRMITRIHIVEESRHVAFARAELVRTAAKLHRWERPYHRILLAHTAFIIARSLISPEAYAAVGLDPKRAHRVALGNPHYQASLRFGGEKITTFLDEAGLIGTPGRRWWRSSYLTA